MNAFSPPSPPYCGSAPLPEEIWSSWNADLLLLILIVSALIGGARLLRYAPEERLAWCSGFGALLVAFISPICALSSGLFAARSLHHLLVVALAAPLIGFALADRCRQLPLGLLAGIHILILGRAAERNRKVS